MLMAVGCGPAVEPRDESAQRYAKAWCDATVVCECAFPRFASLRDCKEEYAARFEAAVEDGLRVNEEALAALIEELENAPCQPWMPSNPENLEDLLEHPDYVLRGSRGRGEPCERSLGLPEVPLNMCEGDLRCTGEGQCDPFLQEYPSKAEGDSCWPGSKGSCWNDGLFCSPQGVCERLQPLGEPCVKGGCGVCHIENPCETVLYCDGGHRDGEGVCAASLNAGDACDPLDVTGCVSLDEDWLWCDPRTNVCTRPVETKPPRVCVSAHWDAVVGT